ncbi:MAG: prepilin-type N-terminal cleavage/methylation domain-containing protein [Oscillospiraceae bacterium]|nr:prepilin-type N-terminal cleavage/methylation domain-containing protein [Oscillospiraceae bacterium]
MKKLIVKGFTLIELIVVMAIFMVIMVAAMSMMEPVSKMVTLADVRESGAAQVNSISSFLQSELGSSEYMMVTNRVYKDGSNEISDTSCQNLVNQYVTRYYEGVLKKGATVAAPAYGKGKVHVMTIDNANHGMITTRVYDVNFALGAHCGAASEINDAAINKAYYENTEYQIDLGGNMINTDMSQPTFDPTAFLQSLSATDTTFNITAKMTRGAGTSNPKTYEFTTTSTVPLVNIMERPGPVTGKYYVIRETGTGSNYAADIVDLGTTVSLETPALNPAHTLTRTFGGLSTVSSIWVNLDSTLPTAGPTSAYTFVYSYGNEMLTN